LVAAHLDSNEIDVAGRGPNQFSLFEEGTKTAGEILRLSGLSAGKIVQSIASFIREKQNPHSFIVSRGR
jgi:hypothetical protein